MKTCCTCEKDKPAEGFGKNKTMEDGLSRKCKQCVSEYQKRLYKIRNKEKPSTWKCKSKDMKTYQSKYREMLLKCDPEYYNRATREYMERKKQKINAS